MIYQTYEEKMYKLLASIVRADENSALKIMPMMSNFSLADYHDIISRDNVMIVDSPNFVLNLATMKIEQSGMLETFVDSALMLFSVEKTTVPLSAFKWDDDSLWFFYTGIRIGTVTELRIASIKFSIIQKAVDRFEAVTRINTNLNLTNDVKIIRDYVNSKQFEDDKNTSLLDPNEIVKEINMSKASNEEDNSNHPIMQAVNRARLVEGLEENIDQRIEIPMIGYTLTSH